MTGGRTCRLDSVARDYPSGNLMPRAGRAGYSLTRLGQDPLEGSRARTGKPKRPGRRHVTLGETLDRLQGSALDGLSGWTRTLTGRQPQRRARASAGTQLKLPRKQLGKGATKDAATQHIPGPGPPMRTTLRLKWTSQQGRPHHWLYTSHEQGPRPSRVQFIRPSPGGLVPNISPGMASFTTRPSGSYN
jgi:hypothetical protein